MSQFVIVRVEDEKAPEILESLENWLRTEPELGSAVRPVSAPPTDGEMGSAVEALSIAVGAGGALTVLAAAIGNFLTLPRWRGVHLFVRVGPDGEREIRLDSDDASGQDLDALIRALLSERGE